MSFDEEWFGEESQAALATLAVSTEGLEGDVVEVGCWQGRSTVALANAVYPDVVHAVDTWAGSPGEISAELAAGRDVLAEFRTNVAALTRGNVTEHVMGWREFFEQPRRIRFLHIDAEHTFREVYDNIAEALPMMVTGGIICGDDVHHPPIQKAVAMHFPQARAVASLWWAQV